MLIIQELVDRFTYAGILSPQGLARWWVALPVCLLGAETLKNAYREHAMKTIAMARHVAGLRAAAFLTAAWRACRSGSSSSPTRARRR